MGFTKMKSEPVHVHFNRDSTVRPIHRHLFHARYNPEAWFKKKVNVPLKKELITTFTNSVFFFSIWSIAPMLFQK